MIMVAVSTHSEITACESGTLSEIRTCRRINEDGKLNNTHTEQKTELITVKLSLLAAGFTKVKAVYKQNSCSVRRNARTPNSWKLYLAGLYTEEKSFYD